MGNKILIQNLVEQLAEERHVSKNSAEEFVKLFFDTIVSVLETEKNVKIKGLGTFKLVEVDARESVDVNTGERISIDGHQKVTFLPDAALKKSVNKPFEQFETVIINDGVDIDSMESLDNEAVAVASGENVTDAAGKEPDSHDAELQASTSESPSPEEKTMPEVKTIPDEDTQDDSKTQSGTEENVNTDSPESPEARDAGGEKTQKFEHVIHPMKMQVEVKGDLPANQRTSEDLGREKNENRWLRFLLFFLVAVVLCIASYFAGYYKVLCPDCEPETVAAPEAVKKVPERVASLPSAKVKADSDSVAVKHVSSKKPDSVKVKTEIGQPAVAQEKKAESVTLDPSVSYRMVSTMETHEMRPGDNLYRLAQRYYGAKSFAVYIIRYNNIEDPDLVTVGTKVKIPRLKK